MNCKNCKKFLEHPKWCSRCMEVVYCNRECQVQNIEIHRRACKLIIDHSKCSLCNKKAERSISCKCSTRRYCCISHQEEDYFTHKTFCDELSKDGRMININDSSLFCWFSLKIKKCLESRCRDVNDILKFFSITSLLYLYQITRRIEPKCIRSPLEFIVFAAENIPELQKIAITKLFSRRIALLSTIDGLVDTYDRVQSKFSSNLEKSEFYVKNVSERLLCILTETAIRADPTGKNSVNLSIDNLQLVYSSLIREDNNLFFLNHIKNVCMSSSDISTINSLCAFLYFFRDMWKSNKLKYSVDPVACIYIWRDTIFKGKSYEKSDGVYIDKILNL